MDDILIEEGKGIILEEVKAMEDTNKYCMGEIKGKQ